jgi:hypothetical protein
MQRGRIFYFEELYLKSTLVCHLKRCFKCRIYTIFGGNFFVSAGKGYSPLTLRCLGFLRKILNNLFVDGDSIHLSLEYKVALHEQ